MEKDNRKRHFRMAKITAATDGGSIKWLKSTLDVGVFAYLNVERSMLDVHLF